MKRFAVAFSLVGLLVACGDDGGRTKEGSAPEATSSDSYLRVETLDVGDIRYRCIIYEKALSYGASSGLWCERW